MKRVLCVCMSNTSRSVMLEALLGEELGDDYWVESAGTAEGAGRGLPANVYTDQLMKHRGFDLSDHQSRWFGDLDLFSFSHIVCVNEKTLDEMILHLAGNRMTEVIVANEAGGGIPLPQNAGWQEHRACLSLLESIAPALARQIREG